MKLEDILRFALMVTGAIICGTLAVMSLVYDERALAVLMTIGSLGYALIAALGWIIFHMDRENDQL